MNYRTDITPDQIEQQILLERSQISQGLKRLRDQTLKLEQQNYASASIYGIASLQTLLPLVVDNIQHLKPEKYITEHDEDTFHTQ